VNNTDCVFNFLILFIQDFSAGKNLSDPNTRICPIRKNRVRTKNFRPNFQSGHYIFYISIVRTRFWPEFTLVRIIRPEKNRVSDINFSSEFWHCPNSPTRIWPEPEFLPALQDFDFFGVMLELHIGTTLVNKIYLIFVFCII